MLIDVDKWQEISTPEQHKLRTRSRFRRLLGIFCSRCCWVPAGAREWRQEWLPPCNQFHIHLVAGSDAIAVPGDATGRRFSCRRVMVEAIRKSLSSVGMIKGQNSVGLWGAILPIPYTNPEKARLRCKAASLVLRHRQYAHRRRALNRRAGRATAAQVALIGERVKNQLFARMKAHCARPHHHGSAFR